MSNIIAGRFEQQMAAQQALEEILRAGFSEQQVTTFYVTPPGQHGSYPIGGDHDESPAIEDSKGALAKGTTVGGVVGTIIGAATAPVAGPAGVVAGGLLGAHLGNLAGSFSHMQDDGEAAARHEVPLRRAGMMLAVTADNPEQEDRAISVLRALHAEDIERAQGTIANGDWADFDPSRPPALVEPTAH